ncbi:transposase, partial [Nonomuraea sp. B1E8]
IETSTARTWRHIREECEQLTIATFTGPTGTFRQIAELTKPQRNILTKLDLPAPKKVIEAIPTTPS